MQTDRDLLNPPPSTRSRLWRGALAWAVVTLVLGLVASLYLNPHLMVDLGTRVISCF